MAATDVGRLEFLRRLARKWIAGRPAPTLTNLEYLRRLAQLAAPLRAGGKPAPADLDAFRRIVMRRPEDLRYRLLGSNARRLQRLPAHQRAALRMLDSWPDLLTPIAELRYEPSHSRLLANLLDRRANPVLAPVLLRSFLETADAPAEALEPDELAQVAVTPEAQVEGGRVDIAIASPHLLVFVEVKVDAGEGPDQLPRYRKALDRVAGKRVAQLVYLTLPEAEPPKTALECVHMTFDDLLLAWLPHAVGDRDWGEYLARYLKSVALVLDRVGTGSYEGWTFAEQRTALDLVSEL